MVQRYVKEYTKFNTRKLDKVTDLSATPLVSVIMPVYNVENYIKEAVESILNQTYSNFEFIIIDDCSTDKTLEFLSQLKDPRVVLVKKEKNSGYTNSINYGLKIAKGKYIARMDGDDISMFTRIEEQVIFMEDNPDIDVCGAWFNIMGTDEIIKHPCHHDEIKIALLTYCAIGHPTVMIRADTLSKNNLYYDIEYEPAEDYHLWSKLSMIGKLHNLQKPLLKYRRHEAQVSVTSKAKQDLLSISIRINMLNSLLINDKITYNLFEFDDTLPSRTKLSDALIERIEKMHQLKTANRKEKQFDEVQFANKMDSHISQLFTKFLHDQRSYNLKNCFAVTFVFLNHIGYINKKVLFKYFVKTLINYR